MKEQKSNPLNNTPTDLIIFAIVGFFLFLIILLEAYNPDKGMPCKIIILALKTVLLIIAIYKICSQLRNIKSSQQYRKLCGIIITTTILIALIAIIGFIGLCKLGCLEIWSNLITILSLLVSFIATCLPDIINRTNEQDKN